MKRLKKIANITLQHATTLEKFKKICDDGKINPYNQTDKSGISNSLDKDSVYLTKSEGYIYAQEFARDSEYNIGVCMEVSVNENNLLPSYDFREFIFPEIDDDGKEYHEKSNGDKVYVDEDITWKDSLDINNECRYNGSISTNDIISVYFIGNNLNKDMMEKKLNFNIANDFVNQIIK